MLTKTSEVLKVPSISEYLAFLEIENNQWEKLPSEHPLVVQLQVLAKLGGLWDVGHCRLEQSRFIEKYYRTLKTKEFETILGLPQKKVASRITLLKHQGKMLFDKVPDSELPSYITPVLRYDKEGALDTFLSIEDCARESGFSPSEVEWLIENDSFSPNGDIFRRFGNPYLLNRKK